MYVMMVIRKLLCHLLLNIETFPFSRLLTIHPFLLSLGSCRLRKWYGLECKVEFQNFGMYLFIKDNFFFLAGVPK